MNCWPKSWGSNRDPSDRSHLIWGPVARYHDLGPHPARTDVRAPSLADLARSGTYGPGANMKFKMDRIISVATLIAAVAAIVLVLKKPAPVSTPPPAPGSPVAGAQPICRSEPGATSRNPAHDSSTSSCRRRYKTGSIGRCRRNEFDADENYGKRFRRRQPCAGVQCR